MSTIEADHIEIDVDDETGFRYINMVKDDIIFARFRSKEIIISDDLEFCTDEDGHKLLFNTKGE